MQKKQKGVKTIKLNPRGLKKDKSKTMNVSDKTIDNLLKESGGDLVAVFIVKENVGVREIMRGGTSIMGLLNLAKSLDESQDALTAKLAEATVLQAFQGTPGEKAVLAAIKKRNKNML